MKDLEVFKGLEALSGRDKAIRELQQFLFEYGYTYTTIIDDQINNYFAIIAPNGEIILEAKNGE